MKTLKQLIQEHKEIMLQLEEENIKRIIREWLEQKEAGFRKSAEKFKDELLEELKQ